MRPDRQGVEVSQAQDDLTGQPRASVRPAGEAAAEALVRLARRPALSAAVILTGMLLLLLPHWGLAQGNPAMLFRQMQARIQSLTATTQQQQTQIQQLNMERTREQNRLRQFQQAVNAAAAAGDPLARSIRSPDPATAVDKLATQLQIRARSGKAGTASSETETTAPDLTNAHLRGAILHSVKLPRANLTGVDLTNADLTNSALPGAILRGAKLQGARLTGVDLTNADLKDAFYDAHTQWPSGFVPAQHGALLVQ